MSAQHAAGPDRLAEAKRCLAELKRDRTSRGVTARHLWELAYWRARDNIAKAAGRAS